jgi:hypothetical protein
MSSVQSTEKPTAASSAVAQESSDKVKVLYIGGQGRSGSTVLGRMMGEIDGCVHVGEVVYIWRPFLENRLCSCGEKFHECPFWTEVIREGFGGPDNIDHERILSTKQRLERIRTLPRLMTPFRTAEDRAGVAFYLEFLGKLYATIKKVSGARILIDGSKSPLYSYFLNQVPNVDMRTLHLVRDARAVTHSWQRRKVDPAIHWTEHRIGTYSPTYSAMEWSAQNEIISFLGLGRKHFKRMRYEDVIQDPKKAINEAFKLLDEPEPNLDFLDESPINVAMQHIVNGNPDRFSQTITLRPDFEWQEKMNPKYRRIVTWMTFPLLWKYGYKL